MSCPVVSVWAGPTIDDHDDVGEQELWDRNGCETVTEEVTMGPAGARPKSPDTLLDERATRKAAYTATRDAQRAQQRASRNRQIRSGRRPPRERGQREDRTFTTISPTCAAALRDELENGTELAASHYLFIQEHKLRGGARAKGEKWARDKRMGLRERRRIYQGRQRI